MTTCRLSFCFLPPHRRHIDNNSYLWGVQNDSRSVGKHRDSTKSFTYALKIVHIMKHHTSIHCLLVSACLSICLFATGCKEHYSDGERVGTITKFSKAGVIWDSWDGLLNITQTGMNSSGSPFAFSLDNDRDDQEHLVRILQECQVKGYKVKLKYHQVWGLKNVFSNRGESDYFIDDLEIIDRDFANPLKNRQTGRVVDTVYVVIDKAELQKHIRRNKK